MLVIVATTNNEADENQVTKQWNPALSSQQRDHKLEQKATKVCIYNKLIIV
jgi:hypothetical protein